MTKKAKRVRPRPDGLQAIRTRLREAEEALEALRAGEVDAMVMVRGGEHVITLGGGELAYRILFEQMNEGAVTLTRDGVIAYSNQRFADLVRTPLEEVIGAPFCRFVRGQDQGRCEMLCHRGTLENTRDELTFGVGDDVPVPVALSFAPLHVEGGTDIIGVVGVVTDITIRKEYADRRAQLMQQVITAQDDERRRISRELHDETAQALTALLVGLRTIEESRTITATGALARQLRETVAATLNDVGRLARGLHPGTLDDLGLTAAVTLQVKEFFERHGIAVGLSIEGFEAGPPLAPLLEISVYRVLQEALTNVARHAHARRVEVGLVRNEVAVELRVRDDGIGFGGASNPIAADERRGLGLQGIRERTALLGGAVEMQAGTGTGTTIRARFPLPSE